MKLTKTINGMLTTHCVSRSDQPCQQHAGVYRPGDGRAGHGGAAAGVHGAPHGAARAQEGRATP